MAANRARIESPTCKKTIATVNVDFVATAAQAMHQRLMPFGGPDDDPLHWLALRLGTDDLPDAYRGLAVCDAHLPFSNIAVYVPDLGWRFTRLYGLAYGLESAVVAFNRFPQLGIAIARRCLLGMAAAYFDDELSLEFIQDSLVTQPCRPTACLQTGGCTSAACQIMWPNG